MRIRYFLFLVLIFSLGCSVVSTKEPSLETENQKLQARIKECDLTLQQVAAQATTCEHNYQKLLGFVIECSDLNGKIKANKKAQELSCE